MSDAIESASDSHDDLTRRMGVQRHGEKTILGDYLGTANESATDSLEAFFDDRKIGWAFGRWGWRGPGYDEGWVDATEDELRELHRLLGEYLRVDRDRLRENIRLALAWTDDE